IYELPWTTAKYKIFLFKVVFNFTRIHQNNVNVFLHTLPPLALQLPEHCMHAYDVTSVTHSR
ncbi:hypothetical protein J0S27_02960, partial [Escherichia coli]|uniref:hypothetical protein n=1 Tax=Escherichia coli TaxID=562 RepID=UPI001A8C1CEA